MKFIPYGHQYIDKNDIAEVVKVLKSDLITQGPRIEKFESALCKYTGAKYAVVVSNGTAALHIACLAVGIEPGDEVITSPITFVASANCVLYCGGIPVFSDVQEDTFNISPEEIKKKINQKTKAIIPVHLAGHPCDMEEIYRIARKSDLIIIEDASQALGSLYKGSETGSCRYSDITTLSFHPIKHITTGEGGAVLTNRKDLYEKLLLLRNHGITKDSTKLQKQEGPWYYEQQMLGFNYRITDFQCALGLSQLRKIDDFIDKRRKIVDFYNNELLKIKEIKLPLEKEYVKSSWHIYCLRVKNTKDRIDLFEKLRSSGLGVQVHYIPVHLQPYYKKVLGYKKNDFPKAEKYYESEITLPIYPKLLKKELKYIVSKVKEYFE